MKNRRRGIEVALDVKASAGDGAGRAVVGDVGRVFGDHERLGDIHLERGIDVLCHLKHDCMFFCCLQTEGYPI